MNRRNITSIGAPAFLTAFIVCVFAALWPVKSGVRIPVHGADGRMGYIDDKGRMVIAAEWDTATPFGADGNSFVSSDRIVRKINFRLDGFIPKLRLYKTKERKARRMDRAGSASSMEREMLSHHPPPQLSPPDSHGMIMVRVGRAVHWVMADGSEAFPGVWDAGINFKEDDPAAVRKDGKWGFINRKGETVIPFEWQNTTGFDGRGRACVSVNHKWGVIKPDGKLAVPLYFRHLSGFDAQGMCAAELTSGCGFIDTSGKILIPFRYRRADPFDAFDMARVMTRNENAELHFGWINRAGETVIPCIHQEPPYQWARYFVDHKLLPVSNTKGFGLIDRKGSIVIPPGDGPLTHVEDPLAPGKFWITRIPDSFGTHPKRPFKPACYDQSGTLIWQGATRTRKRTATVWAVVFGAIATVLFVAWVRRPAITR